MRILKHRRDTRSYCRFFYDLGGVARVSRQRNPGLPLDGSCSAANSAACPPPGADKGAFSKTTPMRKVQNTKPADDGPLFEYRCVRTVNVDYPRVGELCTGWTKFIKVWLSTDRVAVSCDARLYINPPKHFLRKPTTTF